jgi:hypothetical protein
MLALLLLLACETIFQASKAEAKSADLPAVTEMLGVAMLGEVGDDQPWPACTPGECVVPATVAEQNTAQISARYIWRVAAAEPGGNVCVHELGTTRCMCSSNGEAAAEATCKDVGL